MKQSKKEIDFIFEISWEVCNKVGGIFTALSSRVNEMEKAYPNKIAFIGPDIWNGKQSIWFKEDKSLLSEYKEWIKYAKEQDNLDVKIGRWDVPGKPIAILVKFEHLYEEKNKLYCDMWNDFKVDSLNAQGDYDESCLFAIASAKTIINFCNFFKLNKKNVIAHFDEWTTGMGLLYIKKNMPQIATVFTTHATTVGRSIAGNGKPLYTEFENYNGDQMSRELNVASKHSLEKSTAHNADCFTTVSGTTAKECIQLLETEAFVTPNGLDAEWIPNARSLTLKSNKGRTRLIEVAQALLGYELPKNVFLIGTSGRYEFRNKGIDLLIETFDYLENNPELKKEIVVFLMIPAWTEKAREDLQEVLSGMVEKNEKYLKDKIITHNLYNESEDQILNLLRLKGINNSENQKIKIIFVPSYLNGNDGIFNLPYYDLLSGLDLTIFPSYYEPWGYTPQESIAFSVPTITTDLAGFGLWMKEVSKDKIDKETVVVNHRSDFNFEEEVKNLASEIIKKTKVTKKHMKELKDNAKKLALSTNWNNFYNYYITAYQKALNNKK